VCGFEFVREILHQPAGTLRIASGVGLVHRAAYRSAHPLWQRIGDIAFLVRVTALEQCALTEGVEVDPVS
jgi:hypothetical protein